MKKYLGFICILLIVMVMSAGCGKNDLEGFWMNDNGNTLTFGSGNELVINNNIYAEYDISDGNLIVKSNNLSGIVPVASSFTMANDILTLYDENAQTEYVFYRDEIDQRECRYLSGQTEIPDELSNAAVSVFYEKLDHEFRGFYDTDVICFGSGAVRIDGDVCYGVEVRSNSPYSEISHLLDMYMVNIDTGKVYWWDYLSGEDFFVDMDAWGDVCDLVEDEMKPVYEGQYDGSFAYSLKMTDEAIMPVNDHIFYHIEVGISTEEDYYHLDDYLIDPETKEIYWYDIYNLQDGGYHRWNGRISNGNA